MKKYTLPAIISHWITAVLIVILFALGLYMVGLPTDVVPSVRKPWFELHKSLGITVFIVLLIRIAWRVAHPPPAYPETITQTKIRFITIVHVFFYVAMILQPISGYLSSSFSGYTTKLFGLNLPYWGYKNEDLNEIFTQLHEISAIILFAFIVIHLAGTFSHQLNGNGRSILQRMLP